MNADITYLMAMSCVLPAVVGLARYKQIGDKYHPFIFLMLLDSSMEVLYRLNYNPVLSFSIYLVSSFCLFLYFTFINHFIEKRVMIVCSAIAIIVAVGNFIFYKTFCASFLNSFTNMVLLRSSYLFCFTYVVMLFICIDILSKQVIEMKFKLVNNFWFWISSFYILSISYNLLIFCLYIFAMSETPNGKAIGTIQHFVNALCYIFFMIGLLMIPSGKNNNGVQYNANKKSRYVV